MAKNLLKVVLDTNVIISSILFGGKPKKIIRLIIEGKIVPITSTSLQSELTEVLVKKFAFNSQKLKLQERLIKENFKVINPSITLDVVSDKDDNRVLEAALEGKCDFIITGDQDLLQLKNYKGIQIITPDKFLSTFTN